MLYVFWLFMLVSMCLAKLPKAELNGYASSLIDENGYLWTWGDNSGQRVTPDFDINGYIPVLQRKSGVLSYKPGVNSFLIDRDSLLWSSGTNLYGALGSGTIKNRTQGLTQMGSQKWLKVDGNLKWTFAIAADSTLWAWGALPYPDTSLGSKTPRMINAGKWRQLITADDRIPLAQAGDSTWWFFDSLAYRLAPSRNLQFKAPIQLSPRKWLYLQAGNSQIFALSPDSTLWNWNWDLYVPEASGAPVQHNQNKWLKINFYYTSLVALKSDSTLWTMNANWMDLPDVMQRTSPRKWLDFSVTRPLSTTKYIAMAPDSTLWAWGTNASGELGLGDTLTRTEPTRLKKFQSVSIQMNEQAILSHDSVHLQIQTLNGLDAQINSLTPQICIYQQGKVQLLKTGTCTLTAYQTTDSTYLESYKTSLSFQIQDDLVPTKKSGLKTNYEIFDLHGSKIWSGSQSEYMELIQENPYQFLGKIRP